MRSNYCVEPTTTTTVGPSTSIEDELLGTQLTTSTTVVTDVAGADALPFTGEAAVRLGISGLALLGARILPWPPSGISLVLSGPGNDASGGLDNAAFPFAARL